MEIKNIIGNGFIGKSLNKIKKDLVKTNYIIYAAGISHSKTKSKKYHLLKCNSGNLGKSKTQENERI